MKKLKEIIQEKLYYQQVDEKLVFNKHTKEKTSNDNANFLTFCHELCLHDSSMNHDDLEELYDLYKKDCDNIIGNNFDGNLLSTNFELIFMLAVMLLDDQYSPIGIQKIGTKYYTNRYGNKNNPYDFSWFEVENSNGETVLEVIRYLYGETNFISLFNKVYKIIEKTCTSYRHAITGIWELHTKI